MWGIFTGLCDAQPTEKSQRNEWVHETVMGKKNNNKTCLCKFVFFESTDSLQRVLVECKMNTACHRVNVQNNSASLFTDFTNYPCQQAVIGLISARKHLFFSQKHILRFPANFLKDFSKWLWPLIYHIIPNISSHKTRTSSSSKVQVSSALFHLK